MPTSELLRYSCKMCQTCIRRLSSKNWKPSDEILVRACPSVDLWNKSSITIIRTYYHNWGNKALMLLLRHHYTLKSYKHCLVRNLNHSLTQHAVRVCVYTMGYVSSWHEGVSAVATERARGWTAHFTVTNPEDFISCCIPALTTCDEESTR